MTHEERWLIEELATANGWPTETLEAVLSVWPQLAKLPNDFEYCRGYEDCTRDNQWHMIRSYTEDHENNVLDT